MNKLRDRNKKLDAMKRFDENNNVPDGDWADMYD